MKKRSSLKTSMCELFPLVVSRITTPVHSPCHSSTANIVSDGAAFRRATRRLRVAAASIKTADSICIYASIRTMVCVCAYNDERGDGLVHPPVLLEEVAEDDAGAEQRHEQVDGYHRRVVGGGAQHAEARQVRREVEPHAGVALSAPPPPPSPRRLDGDCSGRQAPARIPNGGGEKARALSPPSSTPARGNG